MDLNDFDALDAAWTEADDDHHAGLLIARSARLVADNLTIAASLFSGDEFHSAWELTFQGVVEHRFTLGAYRGYLTEQTHPLLLEHHEAGGRLSFYGQVEHPTETLGALAEVHEKLCNGWRPLDRYVRTRQLSWLFSFRSGVLANGPSSTLNSYAAVLEDRGVQTTFAESHGPVHWDDTYQWVPTDPHVALFAFTDTERWEAAGPNPSASSYVIAQQGHVAPAATTDATNTTRSWSFLRPDPAAGSRRETRVNP